MGRWVLDVGAAVDSRWWMLARAAVAQRRPDTLGRLYPDSAEFDWRASNAISAPRFPEERGYALSLPV